MTIEMLINFFKWCSIINFGLLMFGFLMGILFKNLVYNIHGKLFKLSAEKLNEMLYLMLGIYKVLVIVFNIVPWIVLTVIK